ncbi:Segregation and condensation protein B [Candidatus Hydrogenisulfobacillus filiaventi]|uniref:Segregation and condensation protein B n=1 Tax=Candidatus Hydrogenisulfobacillus filiaventi TaxID=2707344 RepID=A0A6F8ZG21_9FIRM|nr:SMC-Scp complex subunit ScpB [Bacillota bacterium]CAB1128698.1 Segregation and condensation protein B [Candidatus Hydrogenisulfobacillus filiaventi]
MSAVDPARLLEAILFLQGEPVAVAALARRLSLPEAVVEEALERLARRLEAGGSALRVVRVAGGVALATDPALDAALSAADFGQEPVALSHAAWETLAVVAYRQPVTRLEIETLRRANPERALATLIERGLVEEVGRKDVPGRPILYGTTPFFLKAFGLSGLEALPPLPEPPAPDPEEDGTGSSPGT